MAEKKSPAKKSPVKKSQKSAGEKPKKKCGGKTASIKHNLINTTAEDIGRIVWQSARLLNREIVKTDEECAERLNQYFQECYELNIIPTVEDMCLALGTHRDVVWDWEHGTRGQDRANMIKKAKQILAGIDAALVAEGKIPQVTYIFRSKNYYGMKDQQDVVVAPANPLGDAQSAEQLQKKYMDQTYGLVEEEPQKALEESRTAVVEETGAEREAVSVDELHKHTT